MPGSPDGPSVPELQDGPTGHDSGLLAFVEVWNDLQVLSTPEHHRTMALWLEGQWQAGNCQLLMMAFRNAGKSTLIGLFAAWLLRCDPVRRLLVLSADHNLARRMVRNVKRIIERHPRTADLKPAEVDEWAADRFTVNRERELRDPSMLAKGISANITGSRADVVICDDVEVPNTCDTPGKRDGLRARLDEIQYVLVPGGTCLFIGTPHTRYSIYDAGPAGGTAEPYLAGFQRFELPLLNSAGASAWPEKFPVAQIETIRRRTGPAKFQSQMMLRPLSVVDGRLDAERLIPYDGELRFRESGGEADLRIADKRLVSASCWWDPAYGSPHHGDASVIACVFTDEDGNYRLHAIEYLTHDPAAVERISEATQQCRKVVAFARRYHQPAVTIEKNGIGRFLPGLLRQELTLARLPIAVREESAKRSKDLRIVDAFDAALAANQLFVHQSVMNTPFRHEIEEWRSGANVADDGLDAVAGCLLNEPVRLPRHPDIKQPERPADWRRGIPQFKAAHDFSP